jgi:hypothetical protein
MHVTSHALTSVQLALLHVVLAPDLLYCKTPYSHWSYANVCDLTPLLTPH